MYFILYSFPCNDHSNPLLRSFDSFWLFFADYVTTGTYNFVPLIVKIILLKSPLTLSTPVVAKTHFVHFKF